MEVEPVIFSVERDKAQFSSRPIVKEKLYKKLEKLMKAAVEGHACVRGVKETTKALRKKQKGICLIAGDCTPIDVIAHLPVYCEDRSVPYAFIPTRRLLGSSINSLRGTSCILLLPETIKGNEMDEAYRSSFEKLSKKISALRQP